MGGRERVLAAGQGGKECYMVLDLSRLPLAAICMVASLFIWGCQPTAEKTFNETVLGSRWVAPSTAWAGSPYGFKVWLNWDDDNVKYYIVTTEGDIVVAKIAKHLSGSKHQKMTIYGFALRKLLEAEQSWPYTELPADAGAPELKSRLQAFWSTWAYVSICIGGWPSGIKANELSVKVCDKTVEWYVLVDELNKGIAVGDEITIEDGIKTGIHEGQIP